MNWDAIEAIWDGLTPEMQTASVGAFATVFTAVVTATIGIVIVVWQIGRQARHAIKQNSHDEALKLKLRLYEQISSVCGVAESAEVELSSYIRKFQTDVILFLAFVQQHGQPFQVPAMRAPVLLEMKFASAMKAIDVIRFVERWKIVDPRIELFQTAINVVLHDITEAMDRYNKIAFPLMPSEILGHAQPGTLFPWNPPNDQSMQQLEEVQTELLEALGELSAYVDDIQREMQNLLLSELFSNNIPLREPLDPKFKVLRLDQFKELSEYFENDTAWGRHKAQIENEFRPAKVDNPQNPV